MQRWLTPGRILLALVALVLAVAGIGYLERKAIARRFADAELAARKVDARYEIEAIGPRTQRVENLVIGDPARPDLTADWAEIELRVGFGGVSVQSLKAGGVKLRGSYKKGLLSFGAVDRLLPEPSGKPFSLPDMAVALSDARLTLDTDYGPLAARIDGRGNLANGFAGQVQAGLARISSGGLDARGIGTMLALRTERRRIAVSGPVIVRHLAYGENRLRDARLDLDATAQETLKAASGRWALHSTVERLQIAAARQLQADGRFSIDGPMQTVTAQLALDGASAGAERARLLGMLPSGAGTPAEPLLAQLRAAVAGLDRGGRVTAPFEYRATREQRTLMIGPPTLVARSGARLVGNGRGLVVLPDMKVATFDGEFALAGGGFPAGTLRLAMNDGLWNGSARFRPYQVGGADLILSPVNWAYDARGLRLDTLALMNGPLGGGRVTGLRIPVSLRPGRDPLSGCLSPSFRTLDIAGLSLAPATLNACIAGKRARIATPRLNGKLGSSPISLAANSAVIGFSHGDFSVDSLAVLLGAKDSQSALTLANLAGNFGDGAASGRFAGGAGHIGNVPLNLSDAHGNWRFADGVLDLKGGLQVSDRQADPRFNPLVADDFTLTFADGRITAHGTAHEPKSQARVADVRIVHTLSSGSGNAILDVAGLTFDQKLQPEMLTTTTLGVIANVAGTVTGTGRIDWTPQGATSRGTFRTDGLNFAAAFGPVTGLKGEIAFSDLLGMVTPSGQIATVASINPGMAVVDGTVRYQLLPGQKIAIEGARWPFAGGALILEPAVLDLSQSAERRLTFRVEGLDAGRFINDLQFENIAATGIFDGTLPMIFDENGGRIEGGRLVARGGGTLAYVGQLSNENLGAFAQVAFDALKSMKYSRLAIDLAGPLDGDVVTRISFAGVSQAPIDGGRKKLPIPVKVVGLDNFPFIFNVTITAPFRKLFDMSRTISDPSLLIERLNPNLQRTDPAKTIQPSESEKMR